MSQRFRVRWLFCFAFFVVSIWLAVSASEKPAKPGPAITVSAEFHAFSGAKISSPPLPYTQQSTGGILQISGKNGMLDLRFQPGGTLFVSLDDRIDPGFVKYCWKNTIDGPEEVPCPAQAALPDSPFPVDFISVYTFEEVQVSGDCSGGSQVPGINALSTLNLLAMEPGETAYVKLLIRFEKAGFPNWYDMRSNKSGLPSGGEVKGVVEVTALDNSSHLGGVDFWIFKPMACSIAPVNVPNEANISQFVPYGRRQTIACNHGDFRLPFELWISRTN